MTQPLNILSDEVRRTVDHAATQVHRRYRSYVDIDDVRSVMYLRLVEHPEDLDNPTWLRRRLTDAGIDYARKEKAHKTGYDPSDEYFYSTRTLVRLLPDAFDRYSTTPRGGEMEGRTSSGERTYNDWETQVIDVRRALDRLGYADFALLRQLVEQKREPNDAMVHTALKKLQAKLGGPR